MADDGVAGLVIGCQLLLFLVHDLGLALRTDSYLFESLGQIGVGNVFGITTSRDDGGFVGDVSQVRTG